MPGTYKNKKIDIVSVFEAVGQFAKKEISQKELKNEKISIRNFLVNLKKFNCHLITREKNPSL